MRKIHLRCLRRKAYRHCGWMRGKSFRNDRRILKFLEKTSRSSIQQSCEGSTKFSEREDGEEKEENDTKINEQDKRKYKKKGSGKIRRRWSIVVKRSPPEFLNHQDTWKNRRFENNDDSNAVIEWFRRYPSNGPHYDPLRTIGEQSWNDRVVLLAKITRTSSWVISLIYGDKLRTRIQMAPIRNTSLLCHVMPFLKHSFSERSLRMLVTE